MKDDEGSALIEFTYLSVLLLVPLVYLLLSVFAVQKASFGVTEAARQAGRAYARADTVEQAEARAQEAMRLAMADQGVRSGVTMTAQCVPVCLEQGSRVVVTVRTSVSVLGIASIPVRATHTAYVDVFAR